MDLCRYDAEQCVDRVERQRVQHVEDHVVRQPDETDNMPQRTGWNFGPYGPPVNKEYLSQIQVYSIFGELPVLSNTVLTVCLKVANSTFLVTNKRTKWAELSRYYLCNCFVR